MILRGLLGATSPSFLSANPEWSWIVAHLMFGMVLGGLVAYGPMAVGEAARTSRAVTQG